MSLRYLCAICTFVFCLANQGCTVDGTSEGERVGNRSDTRPTESRQSGPYRYAVYLENSGSLNGYLNVSGDGSFRDAVYSLITGINGFEQKESLSLYDINTVVIPVARNADASDVNNYISSLDAAHFAERSKARGGDQSRSDLRNVLKQVLDSTGPRTVSILISDCIFSPDKGNALDYLSQQKAGIQGYFQEKLSSTPLSTLVLQFGSDFNGAYYYQDNSSQNASFKTRPYYMVCMGPEDALHGLLSYVQERFGAKGYRNYVFLTPQKRYDVHPAVVINTAYYNYEPDKPMMVTGAQKGGRDNRFRIRIKTDFSRLPVSEAYLTNVANYEVPPGYAVENIQPVSGSGSGLTHEITLVAPVPKNETVQVALLTRLPEWVSVANVDADKGLAPEALEGKTFGIRYLISGLYDAYYARASRPQYCSFSVSVRN